MGQTKLFALLVVLGLLSSGCGFFNNLLNRGGDSSVEQPDDVEVDSTPEAASSAAGSEETADAAQSDGLFQEAILPGLPTASEIALAELLPSTDPNERLKEVERERTDPYDFVAIPPPPPPAPPRPEESPATFPDATVATGDNAAPPDEASLQDDSFLDEEPFLPVEPPEPVAVIAPQVTVSGVVLVAGETYAIVQAPGEPSRHVTEGDRLSRGVVLVKRIENPPGRQPIVVLEERGLEVPRAVGATAEDAGSTTALQEPQINSDVAVLPTLVNPN